MKFIELPVIWVDKTEEQIEKDKECGIVYKPEDYQIDWTCFNTEEILGFNGTSNDQESTLRFINGEMFKIALTYSELKKQILDFIK